MQKLSSLFAALSLVGCAIEDTTTTTNDPDDAVADRAAFEDGGRMFLARKDGHRIALLTQDEMALPPGHLDAQPFRPLLAPPASYDLSAYQTPVKDQLDRGSCGSFATVGAIEAAYRRTWGITLDLSEQYMFSVAKSTTLSYPRIYQYENQSSYWYGGGWPTDQYMLPTEADAPYAGYSYCPAGAACTPLSSIPGATSLVWSPDPATSHVTQQMVDDFEYSPLHIPQAARNNARYGVATYTNYSVDDSRNTTVLESLISSNTEVVFSTVTSWRMLPSGILDYDASVAGGGHVILLIGYDRTAGYFLAKNSWGGTAPSAYLKLSYNFIRNAGWGAAVVNSVVSPYAGAQAKAKWFGKWNEDHEGWTGTLVVRRITDIHNAAARLGTYYLYGSPANGHSVNAISIDADRGLLYYIANETENAPGTLSGQPFMADQYDWTPAHAAGTAYWSGGEGGVHLGRDPLPMPYSNTFTTSEWLGTWDVNNNGNAGTLTISAVTATSGDYVVTASLLMGGVWRTISGTVERARPGIAHFLVDGVNNYTLHYHFWEDRLASGFVTRTGVVRSGVHAVKR